MDNPQNLKPGDRVYAKAFGMFGDDICKATVTGHPIAGRVPIRRGFRTRITHVGRVIKVEEGTFMENVNWKKLKPAIIAGVIVLFIFIIGAWFAGNFNDLVVKNNQVKNSIAKIETQEQRRYDLVDNIVGSVKGAQKQEVEVFGRIADARKITDNPSASPEQKAEASQVVSSQVTALIPRLQEAYPELKSNEQVSKLIGELQNTEGQIAKARDTFNDTANNFNTNVQSFPKNVFANMFGFKEYPLYKADDAANKAPKVNF